MQSASPQARIRAAKFAVVADDTEITFLPGGGHMAVSRFETAEGAIEITIECFDRFGVSDGRQTASIHGCRLSAAA